jgi:hypothetical protein
MGGGTWNSRDYEDYSARTAYTTKSTREVFASSSVPAALDPQRVTIRESCDSVDNPASTPLIFALDVTGSMGEYAALIAKEGLPALMTAIMTDKPVSNPHIMFMGVDDAHTYKVRDSLQVSQFEADLRILEQLREIFLVSGGGGNRSESYDLPWYFAAHKTKIDCFDKRGEKGFLFTMGDEEAPYRTMTADKFRQVFGTGEYQDMTPAEMLAEAKERYHVFHIVIEQGDYARTCSEAVRRTWTDLMGPNVLFLKDFRALPDLILATLKIVRGAEIGKVIASADQSTLLEHAFGNALAETV